MTKPRLMTPAEFLEDVDLTTILYAGMPDTYATEDVMWDILATYVAEQRKAAAGDEPTFPVETRIESATTAAATDEPDERGDFPCCTAPAPVGAAVTLDLDAIEADALAALNPSRCRCTVQSGSVYSSQCPRHDPRDPGYRAPWQMPPATALALVAEVRRLTEDIDQCWVPLYHDTKHERDQAEARAESAEAEVVTLRARLAEAEALHWKVGGACSHCSQRSDYAVAWPCETAVALAGTTGEGE